MTHPRLQDFAMSQFIGFWALVFWLPSALADSGQPEADLILRGGKIVTLDPELGEQQAIAIRGAFIERVGSHSDVDSLVGAETEIMELDGRLVVPGFIEGHGHFLSLGRAKQVLDLSAASNWEEILGLVAEAARNAPPGQWIHGGGWHQEKWDSLPEDSVEGVPRNRGLTRVAPDNPVLLTHASGHAAFANQAALEAAGVSESTTDPLGGTLVRAPDGSLTGLLRETAAALVERAADASESGSALGEWEARMRERVRLAGEEALRHGVTSFHDAGASPRDIDLFVKLESEGALPVRLYVMVMGPDNEQLDALLPRYLMPSEGDDYLAVRSIKRMIDGALGSHGAWLLEPYADMPESEGLILEPITQLEEAALIAARHGFQVNTHAIGTRANREILDLYQRVWERLGISGHDARWRIEHAQHMRPSDVRRFGQLGVIAAVQGIHCASDAPWIPLRLGKRRARETSYPWRDLIDTGALVGNGTDTPVEPISVMASFHASVTRLDSRGQAFHPRQAMSREEALRSYTINNAYAAFEEEFKGSLSPGKLADVAVLSADMLTVPEHEIPNIQVDYTILGGKIAYDRARD